MKHGVRDDEGGVISVQKVSGAAKEVRNQQPSLEKANEVRNGVSHHYDEGGRKNIGLRPKEKPRAVLKKLAHIYDIISGTMPATKGAIRKLRADKRKTAGNSKIKTAYKEAVSKMKKQPSAAKLTIAYKMLDRAANSRVIHKNKAARLKSRLSGLVKKKK